MSAAPALNATAIARLGAAIAKGALKDEPFAAELISRQYVRKLTGQTGGKQRVASTAVWQVLRDLAKGRTNGKS